MPPRPVRVFIVDDHTLVREALCHLLQADVRFNVVGEAANATDALLALDEAAPDVVLMDVNLPGEMSGIELTRFLKAAHASCTVIGLSMHDSLEVEDAMLSAGAATFLTKNVAGSVLVEAIESHAHAQG